MCDKDQSSSNYFILKTCGRKIFSVKEEIQNFKTLQILEPHIMVSLNDHIVLLTSEIEIFEINHLEV